MEADNSVGKVGVQSHSRGECNWHVSEQTHAEGCQSGNGSCGSDEIAFDFLDAQRILGVGVTDGVVGESRTNACTTAV